MRFAENLKAIADAPNESSSVGKLGDGFHQRSKPSDGSGAQIVAVREPAGEDHTVRALQIPIFVPQHHGFVSA